MPLAIRRLASPADAHLCATLMTTSEPWISLGRTYDESLAMVDRRDAETYVAFDGDAFRGFIIIVPKMPLGGYIQIVAVAQEARGGGVGAQLVRFAEERIFREVPNVFLTVSSTNPRARALYERLGYEFVGTLTNFLVSGTDEHLMRKSIAPVREWYRGSEISR